MKHTRDGVTIHAGPPGAFGEDYGLWIGRPGEMEKIAAFGSEKETLAFWKSLQRYIVNEAARKIEGWKHMKAWSVTDKNCDGYTYIIYAETRGKAIVTAMKHTEGAFDDYEFTEIRARRAPNLDHDCYDAKITRNQFGPEDARIFCYGLVDSMTDEILGKCKKCKAYVENAGPPKEG